MEFGENFSSHFHYPKSSLTAIERFLKQENNHSNGFTLSFSTSNSSLDDHSNNMELSALMHHDKSKVSRKKALKNSSFVPLIKGQWTEEEDRVLLKLVRQYGDRKWAQIAEKVVGRAGKQCRERWNNHLRPDIKKDGWSKEEEVMLIEAHMKIGNRWAEIAKQIPGRTENSIKNHWNATKRRQNSRRNVRKSSQKVQIKAQKPTILQDYIKRSNLDNSVIGSQIGNVNSVDSLGMTNIISTHSPVDDENLSGLIMKETYNDELNFMIKFFSDKNGHDMNRTTQKVQELENTTNTHMSSDQYISYLLDGSLSTNNENCYSNNNMTTMNNLDNYLTSQQQHSSSWGNNRDMDLMEMINSSNHSQFTFGGSNTSNINQFFLSVGIRLHVRMREFPSVIILFQTVFALLAKNNVGEKTLERIGAKVVALGLYDDEVLDVGPFVWEIKEAH
ncbi:transcription factor MYB119-like [Impatiens glandulifera]|uniref:transcription factor MYB119-like n=1 Tax=Impatiens glandulifera TaxID=253017 RepID=UPI001FB04B4B|nr:transcription factor MYB119-like [Impatiens glandulifera]